MIEDDPELAELLELERAERAGEAPPPNADANQTRLDQLKQLGELHATGVLTDAEFATEKARILGA